MFDLLSYGGGALGIIGIFYFVIRFFIDKKDAKDKIIEQNQEEKKEKIKEKQKEIDDKETDLKNLENESKEVKNEINKTVDKYKKEKKDIESSDDVAATVNKIEEEW